MAANAGIIESNIVLKQGDTFAVSFSFTDDEGQPITGKASNFKSQVRSRANGLLYGDLTVREDEDLPGTYILQSGVTDDMQETQSWKEGSAVFDIQYTDDDIVKSSHTIKFTIIGDVTS